MVNEKKVIHKKITVTVVLSFLVFSGLNYFLEDSSQKWVGITMFIYGFAAFIYSINLLNKLFDIYSPREIFTRKNNIAIAIAIIAVGILAMSSKNSSYTECGVGSVYAKHYYHDGSYSELTSEGCDMTIGGVIKLSGAFIIFFYLSLLIIERNEKKDELESDATDTFEDKFELDKEKSVKQELDEDIQAKFDDSFGELNDNSIADDDYKNIPF